VGAIVSTEHHGLAGTIGRSRWDTVAVERTVLLVARTWTSAIRLLDVRDLFRGDFRLRFLFTVDEGSRSGAGVTRLLRDAGVDWITPWSEIAGGVGYDLAVCASEQIDLDAITSTTVVLPHGVGFHKNVPDGDGPATRVAGLPPAAALRTGRVRLLLSHPEQQDQLVAVNPDITGQAVVTGDPTFDRLRASVPLRDDYRRALDAGQRAVIMLSSTWGRASLFGQHRDLAGRLHGELPADEYRVCLALHPNIWARHGRATVRTWLADCLDAGLHLLPPEGGWQATLLAADLLVGDHGSITLLGAALGTPILLAAAGDLGDHGDGKGEVVAGTPVADLLRVAPRLDTTGSFGSLRGQVDQTIAGHDRNRFQAITTRVFAHVGEATDRLRDLLYRELGLTPPSAAPMLRRLAEPGSEHHPALAFDVYAHYAAPATVTLTRYPRPVHDPTGPIRPSHGGQRHLTVDAQCVDLGLLEIASVLTHHSPLPYASARDWSVEALRHYPGARVAAAATGHGCVAALRDGRRVTVTSTRGDGASGDPTTVLGMVLGSTIYCCLLAGHLHDGPVTIHVGAHMIPVELTVH